MNYMVNDKPNPRGEVLIGGNGVFAGYYKDEENSKDTITEDGYVKTGDVAELLPNGSIKLFDRRKNFFKLS